MRTYLIATAFLLAGCARLGLNRPVEPKAVDQVVELQDAYDARLARFAAVTEPRQGWPTETDCDATLWAGEACAGGAMVAIARAEYSPGEIHRRPDNACWTEADGDVGARSTVSRDMLSGYMACLWATKNLPALERLADFADANGTVMGEPSTQASVYLMPNLTGLLGRMLFALSDGADDRWYRHLGYDYPDVGADYEEHLQVVGLYLQGDLAGGLTDQGLARLAVLAQSRPEDYLFQAVHGVYSGDLAPATALLLSDIPAPTYVRGEGAALMAEAHWLLAARIVLRRANGG